MSYTIRPARVDDAGGIAAVHVASWQESYRGLIPDDVLAQQSVEAREIFWRGHLEQPSRGGWVLETDGAVTGFGDCGPNHDPMLESDGEINSLYLLQSAQGQGAGRGLMEVMLRALATGGYATAGLWVAKGNTGACGFYEHLGGKLVGERVQDRRTFKLPVVAYRWAL
ncbi:GNAT family N-acetyltransferase [Lacibacterium aquatile]|uniref:GNAT family N-acetyltransferase n=1 Tax=Lacibacterium aquatile TaxID=1168082 RepID=A0ABW5DR40_9PROT